MRAYL